MKIEEYERRIHHVELLHRGDESGLMSAHLDIVGAITAHAVRNRDRVAVRDDVTTLTYGDLISRAAALSVEIDALPNPESPVGIFLSGSAAYVVAIVALLMAARTSVPMNSTFPREYNRRIVGCAGMETVIVDSQTGPMMAEIAPELRQVQVSSIGMAAFVPCWGTSGGSPDRIFTITFTSGTTGNPKGVSRSERSLSYRLAGFAPDMALTANDRFPILESISVGVAVNTVLNCLFSGAQLGIFDLTRLGLSATRRLLCEFRPSAYSMVPTTFRTLFEPADAAMACLVEETRWVRLGGDPVRHSDVNLYRRRFPETCRLMVAIGASEIGTYASWYIDHKTPLDRPLIPVGYPGKDMEIELIAEDGSMVAAGEIGEIVVTSPALAVGYWQDEALTRERLTPSSKHPGMMRFRTGDFGRFLPNGLLEFVGRRDRQIKVRGNTVHPGEVEAALALCPGVSEISVVAREELCGMTLVAYFTAAAESRGAEQELRRWCRAYLPAPMRPTHFFMLSMLPKLPNGKLDLKKLMAVAEKAVSAHSAVAAALEPSDLSAVVCRAWSQILSAESFEADTTFEDAGGDSIKGIELLVHLETLLDRSIPIGTLDLEVRPSELIRRLVRPALVVSNSEDPRPFIVLFEGMWGDDVSSSDFYRRLAQRFPIMALDYRLGGDALAGTYDAELYFDAGISAIRRSGQHRRLWLVGYSYGGKLAAETARRLLASGTAVEAVIVLDGEAGASMPSFNASGHALRRSLGMRLRAGPAKHGGVGRFILNAFAVRFAPFTVQHRATYMLPWLFALIRRFGSAETYRLVSREVVAHTRKLAFGDLPSGALPMSLWLFVTDDPRHARSRADLGWGDRCQNVKRILVGGRHTTMLSPPTRDVVIAEMNKLEMILRASSLTVN